MYIIMYTSVYYVMSIAVQVHKAFLFSFFKIFFQLSLSLFKYSIKLLAFSLPL